MINNTFFFEIVQRIENYEGYGANNALFRIAAQKTQYSHILIIKSFSKKVALILK